jgi:hypothetical protein
VYARCMGVTQSVYVGLRHAFFIVEQRAVKIDGN